jgi:hypothetical protein
MTSYYRDNLPIEKLDTLKKEAEKLLFIPKPTLNELLKVFNGYESIYRNTDSEEGYDFLDENYGNVFKRIGEEIGKIGFNGGFEGLKRKAEVLLSKEHPSLNEMKEVDEIADSFFCNIKDEKDFELVEEKYGDFFKKLSDKIDEIKKSGTDFLSITFQVDDPTELIEKIRNANAKVYIEGRERPFVISELNEIEFTAQSLVRIVYGNEFVNITFFEKVEDTWSDCLTERSQFKIKTNSSEPLHLLKKSLELVKYKHKIHNDSHDDWFAESVIEEVLKNKIPITNSETDEVISEKEEDF